MSAHVVGAHFAETVRRFDAGDIAGAIEVFRTATGVIDALNGAGAQAVMAKAALEASASRTTGSFGCPTSPRRTTR